MAPEMPETFWQTDEMRDALATRDMGRVSKAYRNHPFHGPSPLPQERVAECVGVTQRALVITRETRSARAIRELTRLRRHFTGPGSHPAAAELMQALAELRRP
jgi:hypothetical protein